MVVPRRAETNEGGQVPVELLSIPRQTPSKIGPSDNLKKIGCNVPSSHEHTARSTLCSHKRAFPVTSTARTGPSWRTPSERDRGVGPGHSRRPCLVIQRKMQTVYRRIAGKRAETQNVLYRNINHRRTTCRYLQPNFETFNQHGTTTKFSIQRVGAFHWSTFFVPHNPPQPTLKERNRDAGTTKFVIATPIPEVANTCYFGPVNRRLIIPFHADPLGPKTRP